MAITALLLLEEELLTSASLAYPDSYLVRHDAHTSGLYESEKRKELWV